MENKENKRKKAGNNQATQWNWNVILISLKFICKRIEE